MGRRVWIKHEEKTRRHQPGGGNENKGKVCRCCDVRPQRDLTIPRWPFRYPIKHPFPHFTRQRVGRSSTEIRFRHSSSRSALWSLSLN
jgi:hypothetical protein